MMQKKTKFVLIVIYQKIDRIFNAFFRFDFQFRNFEERFSYINFISIEII